VGTKEAIDTVMKLGMGHPMGPLTLADLIGLDVCLSILNVLYEGFKNEKYKPAPLLVQMVKEGRLGRKNGKGFYRYEGRKRSGPDAFIYSKIPPGSVRKDPVGQDEIVDRAILLMMKEAALCLEENIIDRPDLLDATLVFGIGFPPFRGGLLRYADRLGATSIAGKLEGYAKKYGERFAPPPSLQEMAAGGKGFYR
jgi:3-hydroxyacyl-CoA dehydrogenase